MKLSKRLKIILISVAFVFVITFLSMIIWQITKGSMENNKPMSTISKKDLQLSFKTIISKVDFTNTVTYDSATHALLIDKNHFQYLFLHKILSSVPHLYFLNVNFHYNSNTSVDCIVSYQFSKSFPVHVTDIVLNFSK